MHPSEIPVAPLKSCSFPMERSAQCRLTRPGRKSKRFCSLQLRLVAIPVFRNDDLP
jgi:hypothetical protein